MWDLFVRVVSERERVCEDSRELKTKAIFVGISQVGFPRSEACALHMTGMRRVDRKSTRLNPSHYSRSRMPSSA